MEKDKISEKDLGNLLTQLGRVNGEPLSFPQFFFFFFPLPSFLLPGDKDRIRLINAASDGHTFDCSQIKRIVEKVIPCFFCSSCCKC